MKLFTSNQQSIKSSFGNNTNLVVRFSKISQSKSLFSKFLLMFGFIFSFFIGGLNAQTSYTTAGTYTWTCPAGVTSVQVEAWGGGGGGAGVGSSANNYLGGGGAGGNYSKATISVTPLQTYVVTVGAGGNGGGTSSSNSFGLNGGTTSFSNLLFASGGTGGMGGNAAQKAGIGGVNGGIHYVTVTGGSGYTTAPAVTIGTAWASGATYTLNQQVTNASKLYTVTTAGTAGTTAPTHTSGAVAANGGTATLTYAGVAATGSASLSAGALSYVQILNPGSGYLSAPSITLTGGGGSGATATAFINAVNVTGATTSYIGGNGSAGAYIATCASNLSGAGGSSAGTGSNGNNATNATASTAVCSTAVFTAATFGAAVSGGGAGAGPTTVSNVGNAATQVGGGGGGAAGVTKVGGAGYQGKLVITFPSISTSGTLLGFSTTLTNASASQSFSISGSNLNDGILVTAPTGFEVSTDDASFSSSLTIAASSGTVSSTTIYVRIAASASEGNYNGLNVVLTSTGAATTNIAIPNSSVTASAVPTITSTSNALSSFGNVAAGSSSSSSSFIIAGNNLTDSVIVTAPTNFEVSTSSTSGFTSRLAFAQNSGSLSSTTIFARFSPTGLGTNSGDITVSSTDASSQLVSVSGSIGTFYYQSGSLSSTGSWTSLSDGTGTNPADFTTAGITYKILNNATTDAAWTVSGIGSKIVLGDASAAATTLTISSAGAITGTIDIAAASSGSNSLILSNLTVPTFGALHSTSEVRCRAAFNLANVPTDGLGFGNLIIDGASNITVALAVTGNTIIQNSLLVEAGSRFATSASSTNFITINSGGSATINGTIFVSKAKGLIVAGVNGSNGGAIGFLGSDNLTLGAASTVEYNKGTNASVYNISPRSDYNNLTISGLDNPKAFTGATNVAGTFTLNITGTSILTGASNLTLATGASIVRTAGALDAAPTFGSSVNVTLGGSTAYFTGFEIPSSASVLNNLTVSNAGGVSMGGNVTVNGALTLTAGTFAVSGNTLTINGTTSGAGTLATSSSSNLVYGGSSAGPITIPAGVSAINNLTLDNSTAPVFNASAALTVSGTLALTNGSLAMGANALTLNGPAISGTGSLTMTGALSYGGTDAGPFTIPASITALSSLTLNNTNAVPATLSMGSNIVCSGALTLTSGTLNDGGFMLSVGGNIAGTGTHTGTGKIKMTASSKTISAVTIKNFEVGTGASVTTAAATFTGNFEMNGGNFTAGTGNVVTLNNGVTITRTTGNLTQSGGQYKFGNNANDVINVIINGDLNASSELPSTSASFYIGKLNLTVNEGKTYTFANANRTINDLALSGTIVDGDQFFTVKGNITGFGTYLPSALNRGRLTIGGNTATTSISGVTLHKVDLNNTNGFILTGNTVFNDTLSFTTGIVTTGSNVLTAKKVVNRTNGWVNGNFKKYIFANATSANFELGNTTNYLPVSIAFNGTIADSTGSLTVGVTSGDHPQIASSHLNSNKSINKYFTITENSTINGLTSYSPTFNFDAGEIDASVNMSNVLIKKYNGATWSDVTVASSTSTSITASNVTGFGEFAFAEIETPVISGGTTTEVFVTEYGTASAAQTFSIGASHLVADLTATAPAGFEVSTDSATYSSTVTFVPNDGTVSGRLSIRLSSTAPVAGVYNSNNIVLSSTGANSVNITTPASGNVVTAPAGAPTMSASTATSITENSAVLGATIDSDNSSAITSRGTVYNSTNIVTTDNNNLVDGSTSTGTFTQSRTGLSPQTRYYFAGYAINGIATGYSNVSSFFTLSNPPSSAATSFSAAPASGDQIDLTWSAATFPSTGASVNGYVVVRALSGTTPSISNTNGQAAVAGSGSTIVSSSISGAATSASSTGLTGSTAYDFTIIPFTWDGVNAETYHYYTTSAATASATTVAPLPIAQATDLNFTNVTCNSLTANWTAAAGSPDGYIVLQSSGATPNTNPSSTNSYSVGNTIGNATVAYVGSGTSVALSSIADNTNYFVKIYSYNGTGSEISYLTNSPLSGSQLSSLPNISTATAATSITSSDFTANWDAATCASSYLLDISEYDSLRSRQNLVKWSFANNKNGTVLTPDSANTNINNRTKTISVTPSTSINGQLGALSSPDSSISASTWTTVGKHWMVELNTTGYDYLSVSSAQRSTSTGPRDFRLEYRVGTGGTWTALTDTIKVANDFTTGVVNNVSLPTACSNQSSVFLRWITLTTISTSGGSATGQNRIDEILVTGVTNSYVSGLGNIAVSGTSYAASGLTSNKYYYYRVRTVGANSTTEGSNVITVRTLANPANADYRTKSSGSFSNASIWEYADGDGYTAATSAPTSASNITISLNDSVNLGSDFSLDTLKSFTVKGKLDVDSNKISGKGSFVLDSTATIYAGHSGGINGSILTTKTLSTKANYQFDGDVNQTTSGLPNTITGNVTIAGTAVVALETAKTVNTPGALTVNNGASFSFGTATATASLNGTGSFIARTGSTLIITFAAGINSTGATGGALRTTGRTFENNVNYNFSKNDTSTSQLKSNFGTAFGTEITSINNLTINNARGVMDTITGSPSITINGVLNFVSGHLYKKSNSIILAQGATVTGAANGWVIGSNLQKAVAVGSSTTTFEVGTDSLNYAPVTVTFDNVTTAGDLTVAQIVAAHPIIATSNISQTNRLNFYTSLNSNDLVFDTYSIDFGFTSGNILNSAVATNFIVGKYNSGWAFPTITSATSSNTAVSGVTTFGSFLIGESCSNTGVETVVACNSYTWKGVTYTASTNTPTFATTNVSGCDSVVTLNLTINSSTSSSFNASACNSYSLPWGGSATASGAYTHTYQTTLGCDSVVTANVTINQGSTSTATETTCNSFLWNGTTYTASGVYTFSVANASGCDSVATLNLTIKNSTSSSVTESACNSFLWNGTTYAASGIYTFNGTNAVGCDSIATLNLTIRISNSSTSTQSVCNSFLWNGTTYTASGVYTFNGTNAAGCDSVATLNLTIKASSASTISATACDSYILPWGDTATVSGEYAHTYQNAVGCDSVVTAFITIVASSITTTTISNCSSYTWSVNSTTYTSSGSYSVVTGCNTELLNLTIKQPTSSSAIESACNSFLWNGTTYTASGVYTFNGTNAAGCDSVATLNLTINAPSASSASVAICSNELPYIWNSTEYTTSGVYTFTSTNAAGCDSVATLNLTINTCTTTLNVTAFLEGFYTGSGTMRANLYDVGISTDDTETDSVQVNLWSAANLSSATPDYSVTAVLHTNGTLTAVFPGATLNNSYYVALKHRNSIETWSAEPVTIASTSSYNFSISLSSAYTDGFNDAMKAVSGGKYAMYAGDVNQDGSIDAFDAQIAENGTTGLFFGYDASDCNGDGLIDIFDLQLIENNSTILIFAARPY